MPQIIRTDTLHDSFPALTRALLLSLPVFVMLTTPVFAGMEPLRRNLENAYQAVMQNPADRQLNMRYAAIAVKMEDYEAAIAPLERILMATPGDATTMLRIGMMYYLLNSPAAARTYLTDARNTAGAPPGVVRSAEAYLQKLQP